VPIIDSAYVLLDFDPLDQQQEGDQSDDELVPTGGSPEYHQLWKQSTIGCLELCMFAEGSRHQEEIVVTGRSGRWRAVEMGIQAMNNISNNKENSSLASNLEQSEQSIYPIEACCVAE
jgi:hypothetical protein